MCSLASLLSLILKTQDSGNLASHASQDLHILMDLHQISLHNPFDIRISVHMRSE